MLESHSDHIILEARFNRQDMDVHGMPFRNNDRFVETHFTNHWYNIFEIHAREDDHVRGWYCDVCSPAIIEDGVVTYRDLALDLLVFPDGRQVVLDEDEFDLLPLTPEIRGKACTALAELQEFFENNGNYHGTNLGIPQDSL